VNWNRAIRRVAAIAVASALSAVVVASLAGDAWTWSDRLGFGAFAIALGLGTLTMVWGHRMNQL
jgi:hypothetical protein